MRAQLQAISDMLAPLAIPRHTVAAAPESLPPYVVVAPRVPVGAPEDRVAVADPTVRFDLLVTAVAGTPTGALDLLSRARDILRPSGFPSRPTVAGYATRLDYAGFQVADVDTSVTIPATNRNPAYAVDAYEVSSTPL